MQKPLALLAVLVTLACPKKHEEAGPAPESKPSAAKEIEYPIEALTCRDGVLGKISAPAATASASASAAPVASASVSSVFGDPDLFAPIGDGGVGFGSGGIGLGTIGGFGHGAGIGAARSLVFPISAMPVDARGPRALAVARGACPATALIRGCHTTAGRPTGVAVFDLAIDGTAAKVTGSKKESGDVDEPLLKCVGDALAGATYEPSAAGNTAFRVVFEPPVRPPVPKMVESGVNVAGRLPPEVIRRVIRANFPRIRACYLSGLKRDPALAGKVTVDFVIDKTGATDKVKVSESTLADEQVKSCIGGVFRTISFPEPEGGIVSVKYPITLSPS